MKLNITKFPQAIKVQATSMAFGYLAYNATVLLKNANTTINGTKSFSDFATDGSHLWMRAGNKTNVTYNGVNCDFVRSGNYFMITIPDNYDPTIPFVF